MTRLPRLSRLSAQNVQPDGELHTYANGEILYRVKGIHTKVRVLWHFEAPAGAGDTHYSVMRGSKADLVIRQGAAEGYRPVLYVVPGAQVDAAAFSDAKQGALRALRENFPGVDAQRSGDAWRVLVPDACHVGHEAHFAQIAEQFLAYVEGGALPAWEVPNMIAKYETTTRALERARDAAPSAE